MSSMAAGKRLKLKQATQQDQDHQDLGHSPQCRTPSPSQQAYHNRQGREDRRQIGPLGQIRGAGIELAKGDGVQEEKAPGQNRQKSMLEGRPTKHGLASRGDGSNDETPKEEGNH